MRAIKASTIRNKLHQSGNFLVSTLISHVSCITSMSLASLCSLVYFNLHSGQAEANQCSVNAKHLSHLNPREPEAIQSLANPERVLPFGHLSLYLVLHLYSNIHLYLSCLHSRQAEVNQSCIQRNRRTTDSLSLTT